MTLALLPVTDPDAPAKLPSGVVLPDLRQKWSKEGREYFSRLLAEKVAEIQPLVPLSVCKQKVFKKSEEWIKAKGHWVEGRMVEVMSMEKPPKPKKLDWRVYYVKQLKKGTKEASKRVKAFSEEEALAAVAGALRAEEVGGEDKAAAAAGGI